jgi:TIR domain
MATTTSSTALPDLDKVEDGANRHHVGLYGANRHHVGLPPSIIRSANSMIDFIKIYDGPPFQMCLRYMAVSSGNQVLADWASNWAIRMRDTIPSESDVWLDHCRETTLLFLYELMDRWHDGFITADAIIQRMSGHRFLNILQFALPLDRALCLYKLQYPRYGQYGMHWVAEQHVEQDEVWRDRLAQVGGSPTMNKRFLWLMEHPALAGLGLGNNATMIRLLQPCVSPVFDPATWTPPSKAAIFINHTGQDEGSNFLVGQGGCYESKRIGATERTTPGPKPSIFINHTGQDEGSKVFAEMLWEKSSQEGYRCFYDAKSIEQGIPWKARIEERVRECDIFLCIVSENWYFRHWCMLELNWALESNRKIIPVFMECGKIPFPYEQSFRAKFFGIHSTYDQAEVDGPLIARFWKNLNDLKEIQSVSINFGQKGHLCDNAEIIMQWIRKATEEQF